MVFKSKVDAWLGVLLLLASIAPFAGSYIAWRAGTNWIPHAAIAVVVLLFLLSVLTSTTYTVSQHELLVRSGPFRWRIALKDINRVTPTRSVLSQVPRCPLTAYELSIKAVANTSWSRPRTPKDSSLPSKLSARRHNPSLKLSVSVA
jgi:hypothetical protein